jgi:phage major head subunit gpT-like protein
MKKITVELNTESIKNAVELLKQRKKIISDTLIPEYLERTAEWIIAEADRILEASDIGDNVKQYIQNAWVIDKVSNSHIIVKNLSQKSAYVEFGVGIIGQTAQHPNARNTGYEYNVDSPHKYGQGFWQFKVENQSELDIPQDAIIDEHNSADGLSIITQGTQGVWFLFNAMQNYKMSEKQRLWNELVNKYLG